jgi:putative transposase
MAHGWIVHPPAERSNHVWAYDFVEDRTHDGRRLRMLTIVDEFSHACLAIRVNRKLKAINVINHCERHPWPYPV